MEYRKLGKTQLTVSAISLGTVSLGVPYGIRVSGDFGKPARKDAIQLLQAAADLGINLFDTAPGYGDSERLLGEAFRYRDDVYIATKVALPRATSSKERWREIRASLQSSLKNLRREVLDVVQIHNAAESVIRRGELTDLLIRARTQGLVRFLGASVYGEPAANSVLESPGFDLVQIAYSVLDQRPAESLFSKAKRNGVGILVRSALLKGVLTSKAEALPEAMAVLRAASLRAREAMNCSPDDLPAVALRFCLSTPSVSSVLLGARTRKELEQGVSAWRAGPLPGEMMEAAVVLGLTEERWLNPSLWPIT